MRIVARLLGRNGTYGPLAGRRRGGTLISVLGCALAFAAPAGAAARHFEQVSPAQKGQGDIIADGETTIAGRAGDAVAFSTRTPFGDQVGSGVSGQTQYVARRGGGGWVSHAVTPTPRPDTVQTFFSATKLQTFSDDLASAVVWGYDLPGGGGTPARNNIYVEDTASRALQPLTLSQALSPFAFLTTTDWGTSADAQHVAFVTSEQMLPDAVPAAAPGVSNVYQWDAGKGLSLAGILPEGTVPSGGSVVQPADQPPNDYRAAMSADGSRLVFAAAPDGEPELYMRIDGSTTVPISQPAGNPDSLNVHLQLVTPDGHTVFFLTDSGLVPGDTNDGPDLYRWSDSGDPGHDGTLTQISTDGQFGLDAQLRNGVIGASDDGTVVYYETTGSQLVVWDNGTSRLLSADDLFDSAAKNSQAADASRPGLGRVTPDGRWLAFVSHSTLVSDGVHGLTGEVTNAHYEMYVYSLADDRLRCVSCPSGAATSNASVVPDVTSGDPVLFDDAIRPQFLGAGGKVFFSTAEALVAQDVNGVEDVYEYDGPTGTLRLVSAGTGKDPSSFADASASGSDVFIQTRQQLAAGDRDGLVDLYDATTRPALPVAAQTPAADCQGDSCQPAGSGGPPDEQVGSLSFQGNRAGPTAGKALRVPGAVRAHGSVVALRVRLLVSGRLGWRGRGVRSGSVSHGRGVFSVRVRLDRRARETLKARGRFVTPVRLTLVRSDGTRVSAISRVTFTATKRGR